VAEVSRRPTTGALALVSVLERLGARDAFGVPGTESLELWEALRTSSVRVVTTTSELAAAFAAIGYFHASGRPALVLTIPGPGLAWALAGVAEARAGSTAAVFVVPRLSSPGTALDPVAASGSLFKERVTAASLGTLESGAREAWEAATTGEPGPVLLEVSADVLGWGGVSESGCALAAGGGAALEDVDEVARLLEGSRRPLVIAGRGASGAAAELQRLAEDLGSPVLTSTSGRGLLPESHRLSMAQDVGLGPIDSINALVEAADLVLVLGWRGSSNATSRFRLRLPPDKVVRVDASMEVLEALPARLKVCSDVPPFLEALVTRLRHPPVVDPGWTEAELATFRRATSVALHPVGAEPVVAGLAAGRFFRLLREALPDDGMIVTDSGLHQMLVRRHFPVLSARGLLAPTGLQTMGFGLPAAIGAKRASPARPVVALVGDGGLLMSSAELLTASRLGLDLAVVVLADGRLGLIHQEQVRRYGHPFGTDLPASDLSLLARGLGAGYQKLGRPDATVLREALSRPGTQVVEVPVADSLALRALAARSRLRGSPHRIGQLLDRWLPGGPALRRPRGVR
jgi:thiamine pyrophosphate-dependent acetolactate synthase large subunit-like protein